ncbi:uncharacterized protein N7473_013193 [Penicillium subrubescens]|uniref:uncharacterized protein n=1 Tax=Penicillium subrubescens TaxID=1316194 RepID=UPI0025452220|nr:uncharacterized protein N7473_013193 [Penicillium subrubescens]KAJ5873634.1 hypothetical protein N7473_013193 [Penicillium subrubescens]
MSQWLLPSTGRLSLKVSVNIGSEFQPPEWLLEKFDAIEEKEMKKQLQDKMKHARRALELKRMRLEELATLLKGTEKVTLPKKPKEIQAKLMNSLKGVRLVEVVELEKQLNEMDLVQLAKLLEKMKNVGLATLLKNMTLKELVEVAKQLEEVKLKQLAKLLKQMRQVNADRQMQSASKFEISLSNLLSKPEFTWILCSLTFPGKNEVAVIDVKSHIVCVDMVSRKDTISFSLTQESIESLSKIYGDNYLTGWDKRNLEAMRAVFEKSCSEFMYYTDASVLQGLQRNGCSKLPANKMKAAEEKILSLLETPHAQSMARNTKAINNYQIGEVAFPTSSPYAALDCYHPTATYDAGMQTLYWPPATSGVIDTNFSPSLSFVPQQGWYS